VRSPILRFIAVSVSTSIPQTGSLAVGIIILSSCGSNIVTWTALLINISVKDISYSMLIFERDTTIPLHENKNKTRPNRRLF
jgi:hypothetical protein